MEKVLVCIIGQTRSHQLTWKGFKKYVLDELQADLALAIGVDDTYDYANPFWQHARYRWATTEFDDYGDAFDQAQSWLCSDANIEPPEWRGLLKVKNYWLGGIKGEEAHPGGAAIPLYFRWWLRHNLIRDEIVSKYDRIIVTRSDFMWQMPHPPMSALPQGNLWLPDGEFYWGLTDRHMVAGSRDILDALNVMEDILLRPKQLAATMSPYARWNMEAFLDFHFEKVGLRQKVRVFPYVMFSVRGETDATRGSQGVFVEDVGAYVKYHTEYHTARQYIGVIRTGAAWEMLVRMRPDLFHGLAMTADLLAGAPIAPKRLLTYFETAVFVDPDTGQLRHDSLVTSPPNVVLSVLGEQARLLHLGQDGAMRALRIVKPGTDGAGMGQDSEGAQCFELIASETASWLGFSLKCKGDFLLALDDGRVVLSPTQDARSRFKPIGPSQWQGMSWPIQHQSAAA